MRTPFFRLHFVAEDDFVHGWRGIGQIVNAFQPFADVVGVEHGIFRSLPQAVGTIRLDVSQRANEHSEVTVEGTHAPHGLRTVIVKTKGSIGFRGQDRRGQEWFECFLDRYRTRARATATVRSRESFVQVEMHDVDAEVTGAHLAHERIHVGAVHVKESALGVQDVGDLVDVLLEYAERVWDW